MKVRLHGRHNITEPKKATPNSCVLDVRGEALLNHVWYALVPSELPSESIADLPVFFREPDDVLPRLRVYGEG